METNNYGLEPFGTHKQVALWLQAGKYRSLVHRHDGTYIAADESEQKFMRADTIPLLADALMNWPQDAEALPPVKWIKVTDQSPRQPRTASPPQ